MIHVSCVTTVSRHIAVDKDYILASQSIETHCGDYDKVFDLVISNLASATGSGFGVLEYTIVNSWKRQLSEPQRNNPLARSSFRDMQWWKGNNFRRKTMQKSTIGLESRQKMVAAIT